MRGWKAQQSTRYTKQHENQRKEYKLRQKEGKVE